APGPVRAGQVRMRDPHLDQSQHREERAERDAELDEVEDGFEALRQQQDVRYPDLQDDGGDWRVIFRPERERSQQRHVLPHGHADARTDPGHCADRGNKTQADQRADDATPDVAENVLAGDNRDIELARQFLDRRGHQKYRIQANIEDDDDSGSDEQRARNVADRILQLADDVSGGVPARIRIHHENQADRERGADDLRQGG